jgi:hypothetical protein
MRFDKLTVFSDPFPTNTEKIENFQFFLANTIQLGLYWISALALAKNWPFPHIWLQPKCSQISDFWPDF